MIQTRQPHIRRWCWQCGELIEDEQHIVWFSNRSEAINLHTNCAMSLARGLLANVYDMMKGDTNVTDAR